MISAAQMELTRSRTRPLKPAISRTILLVSMSTSRTTRSSQTTANNPLSRLRLICVMVDGIVMVCSSSVVWKSKNYGCPLYIESACERRRSCTERHTFKLPSKVDAIKVLFRASVARPVTDFPTRTALFRARLRLFCVGCVTPAKLKILRS